jgi:hypothetical protein
MLAPTLRLPCPNQGFSTYLVSAYPIKWAIETLCMDLFRITEDLYKIPEVPHAEGKEIEDEFLGSSTE